MRARVADNLRVIVELELLEDCVILSLGGAILDRRYAEVPTPYQKHHLVETGATGRGIGLLASNLCSDSEL